MPMPAAFPFSRRRSWRMADHFAVPAIGPATESVAMLGARPVKLIIQIPCFNEEGTLPETLADLPRTLPGVDTIEWLVINDGSSDRTIEVARECGVDHVLDLQVNRGLAYAFMAGLQHALELGADIIVNTDADNQYDASGIPDLIAPILAHRAEFVIGDRPIAEVAHFSPAKRLLQKLGSGVVKMVSRTAIKDAPSGFRAMSREAALRMNVFDQYTYTLETIIQAGLSGVRIVSVPIGVNGETRPSRLVRSIPDYVKRSIGTILRVLFIYKPGKVFFWMGLVPFVLGSFLASRWLWLFLAGTDRAHVPSLVAAAVLLILGALMWIGGLLAELFAINRRLLQDIQYMLRRERAERPPER
jgi:glycosyltransferase involved in cell wall biosynthesis